jgi:hypothetical protein
LKQVSVGDRFGRLVVLDTDKHSHWVCLCDCGALSLVPGARLYSGNTRSCGCLAKDLLHSRSFKHGQYTQGVASNIFRRWDHMRQRCSNPNDRDYPRYGGRGVTVCERWDVGDGIRTGFECFLQDMGYPPSSAHTLDRQDNKGPYAPDNCRWATPKEQANNRRSTRLLTIDDETKPLSEWCALYGIGSKTVLYRLKHRGMSHKDAITTPLTWTKRKLK